MDMKIFCAILILAVLFSGCVEQAKKTAVEESDAAKNACIKKCQDVLAAGQDLSNGPCLSNEIIKNWVCDVAHSPRQAVDNNPANQCFAYGNTASHFVEVDPNCGFIQTM